VWQLEMEETNVNESGDLTTNLHIHDTMFDLKQSSFNNIDITKKVVSSFALAVTTPTDVGCGWIARNGPDSLFRLFQRILPEVCLPSHNQFEISRCSLLS
jgi:hypothetical protein